VGPRGGPARWVHPCLIDKMGFDSCNAASTLSGGHLFYVVRPANPCTACAVEPCHACLPHPAHAAHTLKHARACVHKKTSKGLTHTKRTHTNTRAHTLTCARAHTHTHIHTHTHTYNTHTRIRTRTSPHIRTRLYTLIKLALPLPTTQVLRDSFFCHQRSSLCVVVLPLGSW
jgi:hypothetical protein